MVLIWLAVSHNYLGHSEEEKDKNACFLMSTVYYRVLAGGMYKDFR